MEEWFARNRHYLGFWVSLVASLLIACSAVTLLVGLAGLVGAAAGFLAAAAVPAVDAAAWGTACSGAFAGAALALVAHEVLPGWWRIMMTPSHPEVRR